MDSARVSVLDRYLLRPAIPTQSPHLFLSSLDLLWRIVHYNQRVLFYDSRPGDFGEIVQRLRRSLRAVLVYFYPWAGRLVRGKDGRFVINCNDEGVEFVEASIDASFSDMGKDFQFQPFFKQLAQLGDLSSSARSDIPLLSVQVTSFLDGGIAVGISHNHVVADGYSLWHFMVVWGECARGVPISNPPMHDRTLLKLQYPSPEKARQHLKFKQDLDERVLKPKNLVERVFHISGDTIHKLKNMAVDNGTRSFTSYEVLCAHCWKRVTAARQLQPQDVVHFLVLGNCRTRIQPPLPNSYFGNAIDSMMALTTADELLKEGLAETAARIREAIKSFTDKTIRETLHLLELHDNLFPPFIFDSIGMLVASSPRFPVYDVDFGWGRPTAVRAARLGGEGEICLFAGSEGKGSVDVCFKLEPRVMELLEKDSLFLVT